METNNNNYVETNAVILYKYRIPIAAAVSGAFGTLIGFPFDNIKTRMQTKFYPSAIDCLKKTIQEEGITALWRGIFLPIVTVAFLKSISFNFYESSKTIFFKTPLANNADIPIGALVPSYFLSGAIAGGLTSLISGPSENVKIHMQLRNQIDPTGAYRKELSGNISTLVLLYKTKGVLRGLYYGYSLHFLRDFVGSGIYFCTYESLKRAFSKAFHDKQHQFTPLHYMISGGLAGILSWSALFPIDTVKSKMQKQILNTPHNESFVKSLLTTISTTWKEGGVGTSPPRTGGMRTFYAGLAPSLVRTFVLNATNFMIYEYVLSLFGKRN